MNENLEKYIKSLPILGLFISIFLMILFFFIWKAEGNLFIIFLYCLLPVVVNTSIYGAFKLYKNK
ncbi:hypothetical protein H6Y62_03055 [Staphylococcus lugdunensis]|uniref:Doubtful CDS n=1 Tax=Staphylococcus lugdunensis TaxID=28035 RepID=A0A4Q9WDA3_STALU|nr:MULTISPECIES: hypothetical protein [Staphylococcus]AMG62244.1 hypothetical protein AL499_09865 [Staphylococcus lugdunensis]ARJ10770.1 hypothetical protein B7466_02940 [Staphylococcus lugdunensis]AST60772.1 hypothetical protein BFP67_08285 [Staphylococcus lugdunensis]ATG68186.1 hypothetical protein CPG32_00610 [Staphylococcus lugdunensis]ATN15740.1 hypothetical protein CRN64_09995 [Staphylococcus lugdunensis]